MDKRVSVRRYIAKYQALVRRLGRAIKASLREDRKKRAEEAEEEVDTLLGPYPPLHWEAWHRIKGWYKAAVDCALPPSWVTLGPITAQRVELYIYIPPPGTNIPIYVQPFLVEDLVPTKDMIEWTVTRLRNQRSGGASGMRAEHLKRWLAAARKE